MGSSLFLLRSGLSATGGFTEDEDDDDEAAGGGAAAEGVFAGLDAAAAAAADVSCSIWGIGKNLGYSGHQRV